MNSVTIHAISRDSSASYTETLPITENLKADVAKFELRIPFRRYYLSAEVLLLTVKQERDWLADAELEWE